MGQGIVQKVNASTGRTMGNGIIAGKIDRLTKGINGMKIVQINSTCGSGSTGKICISVSKLLTETEIENYIFYTSGDSDYPQGIRYMSALENKFQALKAKIIGNYGFQSVAGTKRLIAELERIAPDIVHLHNLHSHNVHIEILFRYLKERQIKIFWTFHDCWAFTGYCPHYTMAGCDRWKSKGCGNCPQRVHYSWFFDRSAMLYEKKKQLFSGLDLTIITPSQWLADQVKMSFLKDYPVKVINNGIDLSVFYPRETDFRRKHHLEKKFVLLGVAFGWGKRKGLDVFIRLAERLDPEKFQIILVGTDNKVDKQLPENIISIHRTANQTELAEIYSAADLFVNPTREENYPTVNMESTACGTPVLTFRTGGSPESIDVQTGVVVDCDDEKSLYQEIQKIAETKVFCEENFRIKAQQFAEKQKFAEYVQLYVRF